MRVGSLPSPKRSTKWASSGNAGGLSRLSRENSSLTLFCTGVPVMSSSHWMSRAAMDSRICAVVLFRRCASSTMTVCHVKFC